jgi:hypothetical protein
MIFGTASVIATVNPRLILAYLPLERTRHSNVQTSCDIFSIFLTIPKCFPTRPHFRVLKLRCLRPKSSLPNYAGEFCCSKSVFMLDEDAKNNLSVSGPRNKGGPTPLQRDLAAIPMIMNKFKGRGLAPRGCLVRVTNGAGQYSLRERWFAVGIDFQRAAETAVCALPEINPSDVVFAYRRLKPTEIVTLGLRRGQIVLCSGPFQDSQTLGSVGHFSG